MQSTLAVAVAPVTFEATPCGRLVSPADHPGQAHYHDTFELLVVRSGCGALACAGRTVTMTPGTSVLIAPGLVHSHGLSRGTETWSVHFRATDVDVTMPLVDAHVGRFDDDTERRAVDAILNAIVSGRSVPGAVARLQLSAIVAAFLGGPHSVPRACAANATVRAALAVIDYGRGRFKAQREIGTLLTKGPSRRRIVRLADRLHTC
jgi:hypothetical protein